MVQTTPAWIRFIDLPDIFYEKNVLLQIVSTVGKTIKVDQRTLHANRGRFARICIKLDLTKPLKGAVIINSTRVQIRYEESVLGVGGSSIFNLTAPKILGSCEERGIGRAEKE
ncbi:hypothetical protein V2J09_000924 [Rumex salicifolius]